MSQREYNRLQRNTRFRACCNEAEIKKAITMEYRDQNETEVKIDRNERQ